MNQHPVDGSAVLAFIRNCVWEEQMEAGQLRQVVKQVSVAIGPEELIALQDIFPGIVYGQAGFNILGVPVELVWLEKIPGVFRGIKSTQKNRGPKPGGGNFARGGEVPAGGIKFEYEESTTMPDWMKKIPWDKFVV